VGAPAISDDGLIAYVPWRMTGTHTGPIDPPGFGPTGRDFAIDGVTLQCFRGGLIWRDRDIYDAAEQLRQLGLMPPPGTPA
jgi:SnoaL-like polyketide cyclase